MTDDESPRKSNVLHLPRDSRASARDKAVDAGAVETPVVRPDRERPGEPVERGIVRAARRPAGWIAPGPRPAGAQGRPELEPATDEDLCFLSGDWRLFQKRSGHRWSLDDLVTAWVATREVDAAVGDVAETRRGVDAAVGEVDAAAREADAPAPLRALDLGCGLGSVLLMVAWRFPHADVTGIEAQADRAAMGRRSIAYNGVESRCRIIDGDLRDIWRPDASAHSPPDASMDSRSDSSTHLARALAGPFDLVTGTPPYFPRGTGIESTKTHAAAARFEHRGGVEDYLRTAASVVAETGRIVMCSAAIESDRVAAAGPTLGLVHREHWQIVPRVGKAPLVMVDVFARDLGEIKLDHGPVRHRIVVRGTDEQWSDEFRQIRSDLGMPSRPPR